MIARNVEDGAVGALEAAREASADMESTLPEEGKLHQWSGPRDEASPVLRGIWRKNSKLAGHASDQKRPSALP